MLAKLRTFSLLGIEAVPVDVEVDVSQAALPKTILVGLPEAAVKESTHRVERAIANSGFQRPYDRVVINLAPAELPKQAASFDLPITEVSVNLSLIPYALTPTAGESSGSALQISRGSNNLVLANFQIDYSTGQVLADVIVSGVTTTGMAIYSFDQATTLDMSLQGLRLNISQVLTH